MTVHTAPYLQFPWVFFFQSPFLMSVDRWPTTNFQLDFLHVMASVCRQIGSSEVQIATRLRLSTASRDNDRNIESLIKC